MLKKLQFPALPTFFNRQCNIAIQSVIILHMTNYLINSAAMLLDQLYSLVQAQDQPEVAATEHNNNINNTQNITEE